MSKALPRLFLSGPMGSGKSTLAQRLSKRLSRKAIDLDAHIERVSGKSVRAIFEEQGEQSFRDLERREALALLADPAADLIAFGGGTVADREVRQTALTKGVLLTLTASADTLLERARGEERPLLARGDAEINLSRILEARAEAYAECHGIVDTMRSIEAAANRAIELTKRGGTVVPLGHRTYCIESGWGSRESLPALVDSFKRALIVTDENVERHWGSEWDRLLPDVTRLVLHPGEANKTLATLEKIWAECLRLGLGRRSLLLGVGGGVVGDLTGFAAATFMRGIAVVHVATTVVAMVDSSIGGKTGINREQGKNLIGAFYQPRHVLADTELLTSLPERQFRAGFGEIVKSAWIDSEAAVDQLETDAAALLLRDPPATERAIRMAVRLKAKVVTEDEMEGGVRRVLNFGHTLGHVVEAESGFGSVLHGEAVAMGMVAASSYSHARGICTLEASLRLSNLLTALALPTEGALPLTETGFAYLSRDKKRVEDDLWFVFSAGPGRVRSERVSLRRLQADLS